MSAINTLNTMTFTITTTIASSENSISSSMIRWWNGVGRICLRILLYSIFCVLLFSCSNSDIAGTGTETSAGEQLGKIRGRIVEPSGAAAVNAVVVAVPVRHNPLLDHALPDSFSVTTNSDGSFATAWLPRGVYNIEARLAGRLLLRRGITVDGGEITPVGTLSLANPGSLVITLRGSSGMAGAGMYVEGTTLVAVVDSALLAAGQVRLDSLPPGILPAVAVVTGTTTTARLAAEIAIPEAGVAQITAGRTIRISAVGNDNNDGAILPLRTVARGCMLVSAGDTLLIEDGVYYDNWPFERIIGGGLADAPVVIRATSPRGAVLRGDRNADSGFAIWEGLIVDRVANVVIKDLVFADFLHGVRIQRSQCVSIVNCDFANNGYIGIKAEQSQELLFSGCRFIDTIFTPFGHAQEFGVFLDRVTDARIGRCVFFGSHQAAALCVESRCANISVAASLFEGNESHAIRIGYDRRLELANAGVVIDSCIFSGAAQSPTADILFVQNVSGFALRGCFLCPSAPPAKEAALLALKEEVRGTVEISQNLFVFAQAPLVSFQSSAAQVRFFNNTLYQCDRPPQGNFGSEIIFVNNIVWNCAADSMGTGNFRDDPLFAGPLTAPPSLTILPEPADFPTLYESRIAPFRLQTSSPAIDVGADVGLPFNGAAPDYGALEYGMPP